MVGVDKNKLSDIFKKKDEEEAKKKTTKKVEATKKTAPKIVKRGGTTKKKVDTTGADEKIDAFKKMKAEKKDTKELEFMHSKTHQDLINAAYKAAEELKMSPWPLLRAAKWGHFTDDRGKLYDGPVIDDLEGLDDEQKKALKKALDL